MARVLLADAHHGDAVGTGFRRQVEVHHLGKHLAQDRHEDVVERRRQHRRFVVRRPAHVAPVVDRVAAHAQSLHGEHRELALRVVVAGVVPERAFRGGVAGLDEAFHHDLTAGGSIQPRHRAVPDARAGAAQQPGELVLRQRVGHRRHGRQHRRRIGAYRHQQRERFARVRGLEVGEIERAAAVRQPAHDHAVARQQLLAVDGDVLARLAGAPGHHQAEGDQSRHVARPAALDRKRAEVDVFAFEHRFVEGRLAGGLWRHVRQLRQLGPVRQRLPEVGRPARLLHRRQQFTQLAQRGQRPAAQRQLDAIAMAEQVAQQRVPGTDRVGHQQGRTLAPQRQPAQCGAFEVGVHRRVHLLQLATARKRAQEAAQVMVVHAAGIAPSAARPASRLMPLRASHARSNRVSS